MAFPTVPTVAAGRVLSAVQANTTSARTFPSLSLLTKNAGDLLIAIVAVWQSTTVPCFSAWGGGFTEFMDTGTSSTMSLGAAYKWSTGSETGSFTVAQSSTISGHAVTFLISIPGAHATSPPEWGGSASGTGAANPGSMTPSWGADDTLWIALGACGEAATTGSFTGVGGAPTSYTDNANTGISSDVVGGLDASIAFRQLNAASEDPGAFSGGDTSNVRVRAATIAVRPAPTASTVDLAAALAGVASMAGDVAADRTLSVSMAGLSLIDAPLVRSVPVNASLAGSATIAPQLGLVINVAAAPAGVSSVAADILRSAGLAASMGGTSTMAADFVRLANALVASPAGTSTVGAALARSLPILASLAGLSTVSADLARSVPLIAGPAGGSTMLSDFTTASIRDLAAALAGTSVANGDVTRSAGLAAALTGTSVTSGDINRAVTLAASLAGASLTTAEFVRVRGLVASMAGTSTVGSDAGVSRTLQASIAGLSAIPSADITVTASAVVLLAAALVTSPTVAAAMVEQLTLAADVSGNSSTAGTDLIKIGAPIPTGMIYHSLPRRVRV